MKFTKMQGLGNDYVYVNCFQEEVIDPKQVAVTVSDRHFGIGSDGLILIKPSDKADFFMEMYNADGSQSEMCGNGIRCVGKYVYDYGLTNKTSITVDTLAGIKYLELTVEDNKVTLVAVNMGAPIFKASLIPVVSDSDIVINQPIEALGVTYFMTCISMGNPHAVIFVDNVKDFPLEEVGPLLESHEVFPRKANIEFVELIDDHTVSMRVWERGSGETLACGTGTCATAVACALAGKTKNEVLVHLLGGDLFIKWDREADLVYMTGPAKVVFDGQIEL